MEAVKEATAETVAPDEKLPLAHCDTERDMDGLDVGDRVADTLRVMDGDCEVESVPDAVLHDDTVCVALLVSEGDDVREGVGDVDEHADEVRVMVCVTVPLRENVEHVDGVDVTLLLLESVCEVVTVGQRVFVTDVHIDVETDKDTVPQSDADGDDDVLRVRDEHIDGERDVETVRHDELVRVTELVTLLVTVCEFVRDCLGVQLPVLETDGDADMVKVALVVAVELDVVDTERDCVLVLVMVPEIDCVALVLTLAVMEGERVGDAVEDPLRVFETVAVRDADSVLVTEGVQTPPDGVNEPEPEFDDEPLWLDENVAEGELLEEAVMELQCEEVSDPEALCEGLVDSD